MSDDQDDNWMALMVAMRDGTVVPVLGPDLLEIPGKEAADPSCLLYDAAAQRLAQRYAATGEGATGTWSLHTQVARALKVYPGSTDKLRRSVATELIALCATAPESAVLRNLAGIDAFDLYISLTSDDLLTKSLRAVNPAAQSFAFGIRSDTNSRPLDIPGARQGKVAYQLLGSMKHMLDFAIHDGDVLEYLYKLHGDQARSVGQLLGRLRSSNLLLIGCGLPDWLGRSLLRLVNEHPLLAKSTQEFVTGDNHDTALTTFVAQFSPNTLVFPGSPADFVAELARRWRAMAPADPNPQHTYVAPNSPASRPNGRTVFISYASENAEAARRIADQLLQLGAQDVWLDKRKLRGGDDWSTRIDQAVATCDYFLPVLSDEADARREGVYWSEWDTALKRERRVADTFFLPTLIDAEPTGRTRYTRIGRLKGTERFFEHQDFCAPGGVFDGKAMDDLRDLFLNGDKV